MVVCSPWASGGGGGGGDGVVQRAWWTDGLRAQRPLAGIGVTVDELISENIIMVKVGRWTSNYVHALYSVPSPDHKFPRRPSKMAVADHV